jgi:hypothetical protein
MLSPLPRTPRSRIVFPDVEPIVPIERPTAFNDPTWLFEPKLLAHLTHSMNRRTHTVYLLNIFVAAAIWLTSASHSPSDIG